MDSEFPIFFIFVLNFAFFSDNFWWNFVQILRRIPEKSDVCRFFNRICENKLGNLPTILESVKIIHSYSLLFIRVLSRGEARRLPRSPRRSRCGRSATALECLSATWSRHLKSGLQLWCKSNSLSGRFWSNYDELYFYFYDELDVVRRKTILWLQYFRSVL